MNKWQRRVHRIVKNKKRLKLYVCSDALESISYREARIIVRDTMKHGICW